jgi:hypothetical protein
MSPSSIYTDRYCSFDSLVTYIDTFSADTTTMECTIQGNYLSIFSELDTLETSGAIVKDVFKLFRTSSGSGIIGSWEYVCDSFITISGFPTDSEAAELYYPLTDLDEKIILTFSSFEYTVSYTSPSDWAQDEIDDWNASDSFYYNITAKKISAKSYSLTGKTSNEVVTVLYQDLGNYEFSITYSSTNPAHSNHTYYSDLVSCPNWYNSEWFHEFQSANSKYTPYYKRTQENIRVPSLNFQKMQRIKRLFH